MIKSVIKFIIGFAILQLITYFFTGVIAQIVLGANEFYPPSLHALNSIPRAASQASQFG